MIDPAELFNQALVAIERGQPALAVDRLRRVIDANPHDTEAVGVLVDLWRDQGQLDEADALLTYVTAAAPGEPEHWIALGEVKLARKDPRGAAVALMRALHLKPASGQALALLGDAFSDVGAWPEAVKAYKHSLDTDPFSPDTWHNLALALERAGRPADAIEAWRGYLRVKPDAADLAEVEATIAKLEAG